MADSLYWKQLAVTARGDVNKEGTHCGAPSSVPV